MSKREASPLFLFLGFERFYTDGRNLIMGNFPEISFMG